MASPPQLRAAELAARDAILRFIGRLPVCDVGGDGHNATARVVVTILRYSSSVRAVPLHWALEAQVDVDTRPPTPGSQDITHALATAHSAPPLRSPACRSHGGDHAHIPYDLFTPHHHPLQARVPVCCLLALLLPAPQTSSAGQERYLGPPTHTHVGSKPRREAR